MARFLGQVDMSDGVVNEWLARAVLDTLRGGGEVEILGGDYKGAIALVAALRDLGATDADLVSLWCKPPR